MSDSDDEMLRDLLALVRQEIAKYKAASDASDMQGMVKPVDLVRLMELALRLEERVREKARAPEAGDLDYSLLSVPELHLLRAIVAKMKGEAVQAPGPLCECPACGTKMAARPQ